MNLFNKQMQLPILPTNTATPINSTNPQGLDYIKPQQYNQESTIAENRNYISIIPCLFEAIVREYSDKLLPIDIIYFFQILTLYSSTLSKNEEEIIYSSEKLARILGYTNKEASNMRSTILGITKKLEQAEFLKVYRSKNKNGIDKVNKIVPILPDILYNKIKYEASNSNVDSKRLTNESNLQHIIRTKLFVPITLTFIQNLFKDPMTPKHKLFFLNCIITAYKNYQITGQFSFAATSKELMKANNISRATLTRILNYIKNQYPNYFIEVKHTYTKSDDPDDNRYDKSIFVISINPLVIPYSFIKNTDNKVALEFSDTQCLDIKNETIKPDIYVGSQAACSKTMPSMLKNNAYNNKDIIIKESNKDIDEKPDEKNKELDKRAKNNQIKPQTFLQTSRHEHLESEQGSLSSKSLKNIIKDFIDALPSPSNTNAEHASSTIQDISDRKNEINITNNFNVGISKKKSSHPKASNDRKHKDFRYFYPISEKDSKTLNFKANREFSVNFTNQLLLKLYIKDPEKRFKNKFTFSDYMIKALKKEQYQGPQVNHVGFRFNCNISTEERNLQEAEKYLTSIEDRHNTSYEMQLKRKIAGLFENIKAYELLLNSNFSYVDGVFKLTFSKKVELSKLQQELLKKAIKSVYGNKVNIEITITTNNKSNQQLAEKPKAVCDEAKPVSLIPTNIAWHGIRKDLIEEFGKDIDTAWFSKAVASEYQETSLLLLTMPTRFMADWLKNRYGYAISRISGAFGFKYVEYNY